MRVTNWWLYPAFSDILW